MSRFDELTEAKLLSPLLPIALIARAAALTGTVEPALRMFMARSFLAKFPPAFASYQPTERDVFVSTFAKSGTNWAMQICVQIAHRGAAEFDHIHELVPWPEAPMPGLIKLDELGPWQESPTGLRVIKSHLQLGSLPYDPAARYVTFIRDPKEVLVSGHHFLLGLLGIRERVSVSDWVDMCIEPGFLATAWVEHTACFWELRERPNVLVRTFDEAKADLSGTVSAIAAHLGVELSEDEHARVVERSSFAWMKANEAKFQPAIFPLSDPSTRPTMIRRGETGKSGELLDAGQRARIDAFAREQLRRYGSDFPYDALFGPGNTN